MDRVESSEMSPLLVILLRTPNNSTDNPIKFELLLMKSFPSTSRSPKKLVKALLMMDQYTPEFTVVVPTNAARVPRVVVSWEMVIAKVEATSNAAATSEWTCISYRLTEWSGFYTIVVDIQFPWIYGADASRSEWSHFTKGRSLTRQKGAWMIAPCMAWSG